MSGSILITSVENKRPEDWRGCSRSLLLGVLALIAAPACSTQSVSNCDARIDEIARQVVPHQYTLEAANDLREACPASFQRNYELARIYAAHEQFKESLKYLDEVSTDDPSIEPQRLALKYWILYNTFESRDEMRSLAIEASSKFPQNPYSRMLAGVEACLDDACRSALPDLESAASSLREVRLLPFLSYAYTQQGRAAEAAKAFDTFLANGGGEHALSDLMVYVGVVAYANNGQSAEARQVLELGERAANGRSPPNLVKARAVIAALESQANQ